MCARKLMTPVFWDRKGVLMVEFMQKGTTVMSEVDCKTLKILYRAIQNKSYGMLTSSVLVVLLHDHAHPYAAACTQALLEHFSWELFDYLPFSPDLASNNYHLFPYPKNGFGSQCFSNKQELMEGVKTWLSSQAADFLDTSIQKLVPRYDKCLNSSGDYIEK
jgi:hypothetical protein